MHEDNETITWFYDTDYEFLNGDNVEQIIVSGKRAKDTIVRLLMAGVPKEKIFADRDEVESVRKYFKPKDIESVYVLYDLYAMKKKLRKYWKILSERRLKNENRNVISRSLQLIWRY